MKPELTRAIHALKTIDDAGLETPEHLNLLCQCVSLVATMIKKGQITSLEGLKRLLNGTPKSLEKIKITSLKDGLRTCTISANVDWSRNWQEAINRGGPDTPLDYNIRKVADEYPPCGTGEIGEVFTLLNYSKGGGSLEKARLWGEDNGLELVEPRGAFAIGEQYPLLHKQLGCNQMYVVGKPCTFGGHPYAGCVWWLDAFRGADLVKVGGFGRAGDWFLFRKKVLKTSVT